MRMMHTTCLYTIVIAQKATAVQTAKVGKAIGTLHSVCNELERLKKYVPPTEGSRTHELKHEFNSS